MVKCCVCGATPKNSYNLSFHKFPTNAVKRIEWMHACFLTERDFKPFYMVCSRHFLDSDYDSTLWPRKVLLKTSVPKVKYPYIRAASVISDQEAGPSTQPQILIQPTPQEKAVDYAATDEVVREESLQQELVRHKERPSFDARFIGELQTTDFNTPRKAKRNLEMIKDTVSSQRKKIKLLFKQKKRLEGRINSLEELLETLRDDKLLNEDISNNIMEATPSSLQQILKKQLVARNRKYSEEIRAFALTLHFYSPSAYNFLRTQFNNLLPHPETIRLWYLVVDGSPGFTKEYFEGIKLKCESEQAKNKKVIVNVVMDEISIKQFVQYQGGQYHGYVDLGHEVLGDGDYQAEAKHAFVFMAVAMNAHWKVPLGYFLIDGLNAAERANLLTTCLELLYETGAICNSITYDGTAVNISTCNALGSNYNVGVTEIKKGKEKLQTNIDVTCLQPWFEHKNTKEKVYTIWDPCHMVKLIRNAIGDKKVLFTGCGKKICWNHITRLHEIQKKEGLRLATKLTSRHIFYHNEKMKVKLAVQVLSASVHSALIYCKNSDMEGFQDCEATAEFCLNINDAFDILNARKLFAKTTYNTGLSRKNYESYKEKIEYLIKYLSVLKDEDNKRFILTTNRKTGFLGLIIGLTSLLNLYEDLVVTGYLSYILSYKLSQDHLEMLFSAVRRRGGWNNNPTSLQFKTAYKRLMVRNQVCAAATGNCSILDSTLILHVGAGSVKDTADVIIEESDVNEEPIIFVQSDHDYVETLIGLSALVEDTVDYISGFVVRKIQKKIICETCRTQLLGSDPSALILIKNRGNLIVPNSEVTKVCKVLELLIRQYKEELFIKKNIEKFLLSKLLRTDTFFDNSVMEEHIKSQDAFDNHRIQLIELVTKMYLKVRLHYEASLKNQEQKQSRIRQKYTKLILFSHE